MKKIKKTIKTAALIFMAAALLAALILIGSGKKQAEAVYSGATFVSAAEIKPNE